MLSIGTRKLRDGLSRLLGAVRPVARNGRVDTPTGLDRLIAEGVVQVPARPKRPAPDPVVADVTLSELVRADRG
jgi:hypothetical protein